MKILILANIDLGLYKFRRELLQTLCRAHQVLVCVPEGEYSQRIRDLGCELIPCELMDRRGTNPLRDLRLLRFYRGLIRQRRPDAVLSYTIKPNVYGGLAAGALGVPFLANVTGLGTTIENGGPLAKLTTTLYRLGLRRAACVFFQNAENQRLFTQRGIVRGRTRLIPGSGVNLTDHPAEPYPGEEEGFRFLFVGRIMRDKGIGELLEAIGRLHAADPRVSLDVVGWCDEDYSQALEAAQAAGALRFHGLQDRVHDFYKACHCAVLPSYHEGTANVMLEASATARPVISTRVPGCRETFDEGVTGLGCEPRSAESLTQAMEKMLRLSRAQREAMGLAARRKMEREYDRQLVIASYLEELSRLGEAHGGKKA